MNKKVGWIFSSPARGRKNAGRDARFCVSTEREIRRNKKLNDEVFAVIVKIILCF